MGWLLMPFHADETHMTAVIAAWAGIGALLMLFRQHRYVTDMADICMVLGLIGTVLGIVIATRGGIQGVDIAGVGTALFTTLVGCLAYVWLRVLLAAMPGKESG